MTANPIRGETVLPVLGGQLKLRPTFERLVAAEAEVGSLFAVVDRAAEGRVGLAEMVGLLWHCLDAPLSGITRDQFGEAVVSAGLATVLPSFRVVLGQVLQGR